MADLMGCMHTGIGPTSHHQTGVPYRSLAACPFPSLMGDQGQGFLQASLNGPQRRLPGPSIEIPSLVGQI